MATLTGSTIASSYEQLLSFPDGGLNGTSLVAITDGDSDTACVLELSTTKALIKGSGNKLYFSDEGDEYISGDGTDLTIAAGTALNITADIIDLSDATKDITLNNAVDALNFDSNTLSIDASNNRVGIGTAAPSVELEVEIDQNARTTFQVDNNTADTAAASGVVISGSAADMLLWTGSASFTTSSWYEQDGCLILATGASGGFKLGSDHATANMEFWTNSAERACIDGATGNVGIGVAGSIADARLQVHAPLSGDMAIVARSAQTGSPVVKFESQNAAFDDRLLIAGSYEVSADTWHIIQAYHGDDSSSAFADVIFDIEGNGDVESDTGVYATGAADYAEWFESTDGKAIAPGSTVILESGKVRATKDGESPMGVVRPWDTGGFVGNAGMNWNGKLLRDDYGNPQRNEDGTYKFNPDYEQEREFVKREKRDEWNLIGLLGQVPITKGQPVASGWIKMQAVSGSVDMYYIFPSAQVTV